MNFNKHESLNVAYMNYIIHKFETNNNEISLRQENVLTLHENKIINALKDFFIEQKPKSFDKKYMRKVFSVLSKKIEKIDNFDYIIYFSNPFWRLEHNLRNPILQLIYENDYYLARSLQNDYVYLIPNGIRFTLKSQNNFEKMEY